MDELIELLAQRKINRSEFFILYHEQVKDSMLYEDDAEKEYKIKRAAYYRAMANLHNKGFEIKSLVSKKFKKSTK